MRSTRLRLPRCSRSTMPPCRRMHEIGRRRIAMRSTRDGNSNPAVPDLARDRHRVRLHHDPHVRCLAASSGVWSMRPRTRRTKEWRRRRRCFAKPRLVFWCQSRCDSRRNAQMSILTAWRCRAERSPERRWPTRFGLFSRSPPAAPLRHPTIAGPANRTRSMQLEMGESRC